MTEVVEETVNLKKLLKKCCQTVNKTPKLLFDVFTKDSSVLKCLDKNNFIPFYRKKYFLNCMLRYLKLLDWETGLMSQKKLVEQPEGKLDDNDDTYDFILKILLQTDKYNNFKFIRILGKGAFGKVFQIQNKQNNQLFAIKIASKLPTDEEDVDIYNTIKTELSKCNEYKKYILEYERITTINNEFNNIMNQLIQNNQNFKKFNSIEIEKIEILQMESLSKNLTEFINDNKLTIVQKQNLVCMLIKGIICIHKMDIMHGDIKGDNIFIDNIDDPRPILKFGDFDFSGYKLLPKSGDFSNMPHTIKPNLSNYSWADEYFQIALVIIQIYDKESFKTIRKYIHIIRKNSKIFKNKNKEEIRESKRINLNPTDLNNLISTIKQNPKIPNYLKVLLMKWLKRTSIPNITNYLTELETLINTKICISPSIIDQFIKINRATYDLPKLDKLLNQIYQLFDKLIKSSSNELESVKKVKKNETYVLWVRHCESCANVQKGLKKISMKGIWREPFCTNKGFLQAYTFGKQLQNSLKDSNKQKVQFYSSILPRAMQTSALIAIGYSQINDGKTLSENIEKHNNNGKESIVKRIPYTQEVGHLFDLEMANRNKKENRKGTSNATNKEKSDCHAKALHTILNKLFNIIPEESDNTKIVNENSDNVNWGTKEYLHYNFDDYQNWLEKVLPEMTNDDKLHVITSHGKYLRKNVLTHCLVEQGLDALVNNNDNSLLIEKDLKHTPNLFGFLVKYTTFQYNKNGTEIFEDVEAKLINTYRQDELIKISEDTQKKYNNYGECNYKYHDDVEPLCRSLDVDTPLWQKWKTYFSYETCPSSICSYPELQKRRKPNDTYVYHEKIKNDKMTRVEQQYKNILDDLIEESKTYYPNDTLISRKSEVIVPKKGDFEFSHEESPRQLSDHKLVKTKFTLGDKEIIHGSMNVLMMADSTTGGWHRTTKTSRRVYDIFHYLMANDLDIISLQEVFFRQGDIGNNMATEMLGKMLTLNKDVTEARLVLVKLLNLAGYNVIEGVGKNKLIQGKFEGSGLLIASRFEMEQDEIKYWSFSKDGEIQSHISDKMADKGILKTVLITEEKQSIVVFNTHTQASLWEWELNNYKKAEDAVKQEDLNIKTRIDQYKFLQSKMDLDNNKYDLLITSGDFNLSAKKLTVDDNANLNYTNDDSEVTKYKTIFNNYHANDNFLEGEKGDTWISEYKFIDNKVKIGNFEENELTEEKWKMHDLFLENRKNTIHIKPNPEVKYVHKSPPYDVYWEIDKPVGLDQVLYKYKKTLEEIENESKNIMQMANILPIVEMLKKYPTIKQNFYDNIDFSKNEDDVSVRNLLSLKEIYVQCKKKSNLDYCFDQNSNKDALEKKITTYNKRVPAKNRLTREHLPSNFKELINKQLLQPSAVVQEQPIQTSVIQQQLTQQPVVVQPQQVQQQLTKYKTEVNKLLEKKNTQKLSPEEERKLSYYQIRSTLPPNCVGCNYWPSKQEDEESCFLNQVCINKNAVDQFSKDKIDPIVFFKEEILSKITSRTQIDTIINHFKQQKIPQEIIKKMKELVDSKYNFQTT